MNAPVVMPVWVLGVILLLGVTWNAYLMWANDQARRDVCRERRRAEAAEQRATQPQILRQRTGGDR